MFPEDDYIEILLLLLSFTFYVLKTYKRYVPLYFAILHRHIYIYTIRGSYRFTILGNVMVYHPYRHITIIIALTTRLNIHICIRVWAYHLFNIGFEIYVIMDNLYTMFFVVTSKISNKHYSRQRWILFWDVTSLFV